MAEHQLPKLNTGVRFPSPAPKCRKTRSYLNCGFFFVLQCFALFCVFKKIDFVSVLLGTKSMVLDTHFTTILRQLNLMSA